MQNYKQFKYLISIILVIALAIITYKCSSTQKTLEIPYYSKNEDIVKHFAYTLSFDTIHKQSVWIAYELTKDELVKNVKRKNKFIVDTLVAGKTAKNADYRKSGYDRGHLAPAADMVWNKTAMTESFLYSNICPQLPRFNRGIWKKLESKVRTWAKKYNNIYIATGPVFVSDSDSTIGKDKIPIPSYFYKTILVYNDTLKQAIGFVFPHKNIKGNIFDFAVSVDSVESFTNIDFYHSLPNSDEKQLEMIFDLDFWK